MNESSGIRACRALFWSMIFVCAITAAQHADAGQVNIYSATDTAAIQAVIDGFEAANPDISVIYKEYNTRELYEAVISGRARDADVVISSSMDLQVELVNKGLAHRFESPYENDLPGWAKWRNELYGFTYEPVAVLYNKQAFKNRAPPRTRPELAAAIRDDPRFFHNRIGSYDIGLSGVGYLFATQDVQRGYQFWRLVETFGRAGLKTYCCTSDIFNAVASGELVFAYNVIGSYALESARKDERVGIYVLEDYALVMSRTAFVPRNAPNRDAGTAFVNYLLSPGGQRLMEERSSLIPLRAAADEAGGSKLPAFGSREAMFPIRIGLGLIAYLDSMKRKRMLSDWNTTISRPEGE